MKKVAPFLLAAFFLLIFFFPTLTQAQGGIALLSSRAEVDFPQGITFSLEVESGAEIAEVELYYLVKKLDCGEAKSLRRPEFAPAQRVKVSWTWEMKKRLGSLPPDAEVEYWWRVRDAQGGELETAPATVVFHDDRYDWDSLEEEKVSLFWYQGDRPFAQELLRAALEALDRLEQDTGAHLKERAVKIFIYSSSEALRGAMVFPQEWTGGSSFPEHGIIALGVPPGRPEALAWGKRAIAHELAHLAVYQTTFNCYGDLPTWLSEGLAMYAEGDLEPGYKSLLERAIAEDRLISAQSLSSSFPTPSQEAQLAYAESYSLVDFLISTYGREKMLQLLAVFKEGNAYDDALLRVYGFDTEGLDSLWRGSLSLGPHPTSPTPKAPEGAAAGGCRLSPGKATSLAEALANLGAWVISLVLPPALGLAFQGRGRKRR